MTVAADHIAQGRIDDALEEVKNAVRKSPADASLRGFLYQLFLVTEQWDKALTQIDVAASLDTERAVELQVVRTAVACEQARAKVFRSGDPPYVYGRSQPWVGDLLSANIAMIKGEHDKAAELRDKAFEAAPATSGSLNESQKFEWLADTDQRLGPVLECYVRGQYWWAPFNQMRALRFEEPKFLQDVLWATAVIEWADGSSVQCIVPARYPSLQGVDMTNEQRLGRATSYVEIGEGDAACVVGLGQRVFCHDQDDVSIYDIRSIHFDVEPEGA